MSGRPTTANVCWKKNIQESKKKQKCKKSTSTSLGVVFFLVAAKGLNNDRYNGKNVGLVSGALISDALTRETDGMQPGFTEPWRQR